MKKHSIGKYFAFTLFGFILFAGGILLIVLRREADGIMRTLPYICGGIGAGVFAGNLGTVIKIMLLRKDARAAKRIEIEEKDERNLALRSRAKAKAYDMMVFVYGALMLGFALLQVDMYVILTFVAAYLFVVATNIYYIVKLDKEM